ncbi:MAG: chemotaxis protein CheC [Oscillospiraceae bacterium]|nr:chemotaxis protein CheC [Oscillospiraceae bacterium]
MIKNYEELSPIAIDALQEIGNIGSGNAASSLSAMLGKPITMNVPTIHVMDYQAVIDEIGGPEQILTAILVMFRGDIKGMMMFMLDNKFAEIVVNTFMGKENIDVIQMDETDSSAVKEMGNIMGGAYLSALAAMAEFTVEMDPPSLTVDMSGALMNAPMVMLDDVGDKVLFIDDGFKIDNINVDANILLIPEMESLDILMKKLGVN